ncbi:hypothetical protein LIA77_00019 [Sarocladium implicatum]|nr:hypothetical protein LIA77_00019 [Sarocladium implicatum]
MSSVNSEDSRSDERWKKAGHQLIFRYYDPEQDIYVPQLQINGVDGEETNCTDEGEDFAKALGSLTYSLSPSLCERGVAFFFSRYAAVEPSCHQGFNFIYEIWRLPRPPGAYSASAVDGVTASMIAVDLTGLSKLTGSQEAQEQARHSYGIALNLAKSALQDPTKCASDSTMLAVLIIGTYESFAERSPQTMSAWQDHALIHSDAARQGAVPEHRSIRTSTYGILFMGTPHQGGNGVQLGRVLANVASLAIPADDRLLKHLERESEWLQQQLGQYTPISGDFVTKFA